MTILDDDKSKQYIRQFSQDSRNFFEHHERCKLLHSNHS